ncbi:hypothetical protein HDU80_000265, partial [Chytriomyces hyalinus]
GAFRDFTLEDLYNSGPFLNGGASKRQVYYRVRTGLNDQRLNQCDVDSSYPGAARGPKGAAVL